MQRSLLFVPGNRPDRFEKACGSAADLVCIDLEDAVAPQDKNSARETVIEFLSGTAHDHVSLRINAADSDYYSGDVKALAKANLVLPFVMMPKVGERSDVKTLDKSLPDDCGPILALIESARGLVNCEEILSHERVSYAMYGAIDYAGDVGCGPEWENHLYARSRLVAACAAFDVALFDTPHIDVKDNDGLEQATRQSRSLGIFARAAIHPAQIDPIHRALTPTDGEIEKAQRVVAAYEASDGNVALLDGKMIEAPIIKAARRVLAWANI